MLVPVFRTRARRLVSSGLTAKRWGGSFPYLLPAQDASARILGTLVFVDATDWAQVSAALDELEGTDPAHPEPDDNLYNRILHEVETTDGTAHTAWVYIPPAKNHASLSKQYAVIGGEWR